MCSALSGSCEVHGASYSGVKRPSVPGQLQDKGANEAVRAKKKYTVFRGFVVLQLFSHVQLFETPWTAAYQASLSITNSLLKLMSIASVMPSSHLILCHPLLFLPQSFPGSGSTPVSQLFESGGQSIGVSASASVLPTDFL